MKIYENDNGSWQIGDVTVGVGDVKVENNQTSIVIKYVGNDSQYKAGELYDGAVTGITDSSEVADTSFDSFIKRVSGLFAIDIKGNVTTILNAVSATTTSSALKIIDQNALLLSANLTGTGVWSISLQGKFAVDGTFMDLYDNNGNQLTLGSISTNQMRLLACIPDYIQVIATLVSGTGTLTVKIQPINV
jgi:hypothetical protein